MDVFTTQFHRELFDRIGTAVDGVEVWVVQKGQRFRIVPEGKQANKPNRITPMKIISDEGIEAVSFREEKERERDTLLSEPA